MTDKIKRYIQDNKMLSKNDKVVLGVSGGADSVALLDVLCALKDEYALTLYVVHINHGIRDEAGDDAGYVSDLCKDRGIPFYLFCEDIPAMAKKEHLSEEEAGRIYRYKCFEKVMSETGAAKLAVAHHMDDQAETVLFHLIRGSDIAGVSGMRPVAPIFVDNGMVVIRPLLCVRRYEITNYLESKGIKWCEDITNTDNSYARNRLRNNVLGELSVINDGAVLHIAEYANRMADYDDYIKGKAHIFIDEEAHLENANSIKINRDNILALDKIIADRVLYELLIKIAGAKKDITGEHISAMYELLDKQSGKRINLPYKVSAAISYEWLYITKRFEDDAKRDDHEKGKTYTNVNTISGINNGAYDFCESIDVNALKSLKEMSIKITDTERIVLRVYDKKSNEKLALDTDKNDIDEKSQKNYTKYFDCDTIGNTFDIRTIRQGDHIICDKYGHSKKLSKLFKDIKLPADYRRQCVVMAIGDEVLMVAGIRRCESHYVTENTTLVLEVDCIRS